MKSRNLNLKHECELCQTAADLKKSRLEKEHRKADSEEEDESSEDESKEGDADAVSKRKRSGENHTHCHCPLFKPPEALLEFMSDGQPSRRFEAYTLKRKEEITVNEAINHKKLEADKAKYEKDLQKEVRGLKRSLSNHEDDNNQVYL